MESLKYEKKMPKKDVEFLFGFPPIYGIYDTGEGKIYIFGEHDGKIEDILSHEVLHWTVQKVVGKQASLAMDNIPSNLLRVYSPDKKNDR